MFQVGARGIEKEDEKEEEESKSTADHSGRAV
jgi:hypothetical protein